MAIVTYGIGFVAGRAPGPNELIAEEVLLLLVYLDPHNLESTGSSRLSKLIMPVSLLPLPQLGMSV